MSNIEYIVSRSFFIQFVRPKTLDKDFFLKRQNSTMSNAHFLLPNLLNKLETTFYISEYKDE